MTSRRTVRPSPAVAGLVGLAVAGTLAGCAAAAGTPTTPDPERSGSDSASATYRDGTYTATGSYVSPGGNESIAVEVTLKDSAVTAITVTPKASGGNAERYQTAFASGISEKVVGKRIDELADITRVSGSSLTSDGFRKAVAAIESEAKA